MFTYIRLFKIFVSLIVIGILPTEIIFFPNTAKSGTVKQKKSLKDFRRKPLPRFVSLRSNKVNLRTGPGVRYPVDWVYQSKYLPVEIIQEFENWRKIRDVEGTQGWIHQSMLSNRRMFMIIGQPQIIRRKDDDDSSAIAKLETFVVGKIRKCPHNTGWCKVSAGGHKGWLRRVDFWGVYARETIK